MWFAFLASSLVQTFVIRDGYQCIFKGSIQRTEGAGIHRSQAQVLFSNSRTFPLASKNQSTFIARSNVRAQKRSWKHKLNKLANKKIRTHLSWLKRKVKRGGKKLDEISQFLWRQMEHRLRSAMSDAFWAIFVGRKNRDDRDTRFQQLCESKSGENDEDCKWNKKHGLDDPIRNILLQDTTKSREVASTRRLKAWRTDGATLGWVSQNLMEAYCVKYNSFSQWCQDFNLENLSSATICLWMSSV